MDDTRIAIYIRLSLADEDTGKEKDESNSIVNQRGLIHHYLDRHPELSKYPRTEFVDDGYTGTNTDRPAYQNMMEQIKSGRFNVLITKDFSRAHRDYIELGNLVEYLLPFLRVRYISINDGYDSNDYDGTTGGIDVVMRSIIYDAYSKDLSMKEKTGKRQSMKKGRRCSGFPPFGYVRDPENKSMDLLDPEAAAVVRRIFDDALNGLSITEIAQNLNEEGLPTPGQYYRMKNPDTKKYSYMSSEMSWTYASVHTILTNFKYTGAAVGGKRNKIAPCSKHTVKAAAEDLIIVPDMHEAIVTEEEFYRAGEVIRKAAQIQKKTCEIYPLRSLVYCGNCGRRMQKRKVSMSFVCAYTRTNPDSGCVDIRWEDGKELEQIVFRAIRDYIHLADKNRKKAKIFQKDRQRTIRAEVQSIGSLQEEISRLKQDKLKLYEKYCADKLDRNAYLAEKTAIDERIAKLETDISSTEERVSGLEEQSPEISSELEAACVTFQNETALTYDMAHAFVDRIVVYAEGNTEIRWRFKDIFAEE